MKWMIKWGTQMNAGEEPNDMECYDEMKWHEMKWMKWRHERNENEWNERHGWNDWKEWDEWERMNKWLNERMNETNKWNGMTLPTS